MSATLNDLLGRYGYAFIAVFLFIESLGIPIPGETALITAAALAGGGKLSITGVFAAAMFGTITGYMTGYWMGARGGHALVGRFGRALRINEQRLTKAHEFFERHGVAALLLGRFIAIARSFIGIFAGISEMPPRKFAIFNAIGALIWSLTFSAVGYLFGRNLPALMRQIGRISVVLAVVTGVVILLFIGWKWFAANRVRLIGVVQAWWGNLERQRWVVRLHDEHPTIWHLLLYKFVRAEYLALHLTLGWVASVAVLIVFGLVTHDAVVGAPLTPADAALAEGLRESASPALLGWFKTIDALAGPTTLAAVFAGVATLLLLRGKLLFLAGWAGAYLGGVGLDIILGRVVQRAQLPVSPALTDSGLLARLPEGDTIAAIVTGGLVAHLLVRRAGHGVWRVSIVTATLAILGAVAVARLFLGTSYFSTESVSIVAGVLWLAACISGIELARYRNLTGRTD